MMRLRFAWMYLFKPPWDTGVPVPELVRVASRLPPGRALDLGCGTGTNLFYLAEHGWQGTGVDFAGRAIALARRKLRQHAGQVQLLVGDVTRLDRLPLAGPYDLALDVGCFHSLRPDGRGRYAQGLARQLRPGAPFLLYAWQPAADDQRGLSRSEVEAIFAPYFRETGYEQGQGRPSAWYFFERMKDEGGGMKKDEGAVHLS